MEWNSLRALAPGRPGAYFGRVRWLARRGGRLASGEDDGTRTRTGMDRLGPQRQLSLPLGALDTADARIPAGINPLASPGRGDMLPSAGAFFICPGVSGVVSTGPDGRDRGGGTGGTPTGQIATWHGAGE